MWRAGFNTPKNYDDNALFCGGFSTQYGTNHGKCGVCGDPWNEPPPRANEAGGRYGNGIITRTYAPGEEINVRVVITANHKGWFEFRLCDHNDPSTPITHECLDKHLLELADGSGTRYQLGTRTGYVDLKLKLPPGLTCTQCVLQWKWHAGNSYGVDHDTGRGCCHAVGAWAGQVVLDQWCTETCAQFSCDPQYCSCTKCYAVNGWAGVPELDRYCDEKCRTGNCPPHGKNNKNLKLSVQFNERGRKDLSVNQEMNVRVEITANHAGWFEFRLCPHNDPSTPVTQRCLDQHLLGLADGSGTRYQLANNFGTDSSGTACIGCGDVQEEFYSCSDIAIEL
nr:hypothetical protein BaRGS_000050 [Batillaria attramentaria]